MHSSLDTTQKNSFIYKHHVQFLTLAPHFRRVSWPSWPGLPEPLYNINLNYAKVILCKVRHWAKHTGHWNRLAVRRVAAHRCRVRNLMHIPCRSLVRCWDGEASLLMRQWLDSVERARMHPADPDPQAARTQPTRVHSQWCRIHRARGHAPPLLQMAGHGGGTVSRRTANKKLTKLYWPSR